MPAPNKPLLSGISSTMPSVKRRRLDVPTDTGTAIPEADMTQAMTKLPMELLLEIMGHAETFSDLLNMALSSKAMHDAFVSCKEKYILDTLVNRVGRDLFPEAFLLMSVPVMSDNMINNSTATELTDDWRDKLKHQKDDEWMDGVSLQLMKSGALKLSHQEHGLLSNACEFMDLHRSIESLAHYFVEQCAASKEELARSLEVMLLTTSERQRIHRVFYRFEAFRKIYVSNTWWASNLVHPPFWRNFHELEIAQIACIRDFLYRSAVDHYNEIAAYGIQLNVWMVRAMYSQKIEHMLKLHLSLANELARGCDFARKKEILQAEAGKSARSFIHKALRAEVIRQTATDYGYQRQLLYSDPVDGPWAAYNWCHVGRGSNQDRMPFTPGDWMARKWGYLMWDQGRLDMMGVLEKRCKRSGRTEKVIAPMTLDEEAMWGLEREQLFHKGYRGRWPREEE